MTLEPLHRLLRDDFVDALLTAELAQEVLDEKRNIFGMLTQRRYLKAADRQAIEQVESEST